MYYYSQNNPKVFCINIDANRRTRIGFKLLQEGDSSIFNLEFIDKKETTILKETSLVLLLNSTNIFGKLAFKYKGDVKHVLESEVIDPTKRGVYYPFEKWDIKDEKIKYFKHKITLELNELGSGNSGDYLVENFAYSLPNINYQKPERYFIGVRKIDYEDYENIVNSRIFFSRTIFGILVNSLPLDNRLEFAYYLMNKNSFEKPTIRNHLEAVEFLLDFIKNKIYPIGRLINASYEIAKESFSELMPINQIGFCEESSSLNSFYHNDDLLFNQSNRFSALFSFEEEKEIFKRISNELDINKEHEEKYNYRFKEIRWPINFPL